MSEANSGSDLASIRTRAEQVPGGWRITGSKMWTSNAHRVHMMILFARTGPRGESRREGVSQFLVDLSLPGITVRPIINLAGEHDFNEVVFDDVFIPDEMVIGTVVHGWQQAGELVARPEGDGEAIAQQQEVKAQQGEAADQPEFLGQHGKDEVGLFLGQEVELALGALHEALAGERPGTEADHRLQRVVAGAQRIVLRVQERSEERRVGKECVRTCRSR